ncbi:hypothetical protein PLICRDRAFT_596635 [Plicaturopsis crispa FD-325 SS-3]|nr:hypothetical protein PLICRDRAFT_596635 [Plicaturopsis crispa FD-325 SS-3]
MPAAVLAARTRVVHGATSPLVAVCALFLPPIFTVVSSPSSITTSRHDVQSASPSTTDSFVIGVCVCHCLRTFAVPQTDVHPYYAPLALHDARKHRDVLM